MGRALWDTDNVYTENGQNFVYTMARISGTKSQAWLYRQIKAVTSSRLNNTPPIGAPKATDTPAAAAADKTYDSKLKISDRIRPLSHLQSHFKRNITKCKQQQKNFTCSIPSLSKMKFKIYLL